jgi:hypothetical protein
MTLRYIISIIRRISFEFKSTYSFPSRTGNIVVTVSNYKIKALEMTDF